MVNTAIGVRIFTGMMMSKSTKEKSLHKLEVQWKKAQRNILKTFLEDDDFDLYLRDKKGKFCKNKMNKHEKGSFGEYVFAQFLNKKEISYKRVNRFGRDFEILIKDQKYKIDLKTSSRHKIWNNKKYSKYNVHYDVIFIDEKSENIPLELYPDQSSPLYKNFYGYKLGYLKDLKKKFDTTIKKNNEKSKKYDPSYLIKNKIKGLGKNIRVLYRIDTHDWKGFPDNLPGSYKKYDATVFLRLKFDWNKDEPSFEKGYLLLTQDLINNKYPLIEAQQRQKNKGINQVINWTEFKKNFDNLCFDDEDKLMAVIEKI